MTKPTKKPRAPRSVKNAPVSATAIEAPAHGKSTKRRSGQASASRKRASEVKSSPIAARAGSKLGILETLLRRERGMTIAEACQATGWQAHSVRGAIAGALKKRGLNVVSEKADGVRTYRIPGTAQ